MNIIRADTAEEMRAEIIALCRNMAAQYSSESRTARRQKVRQHKHSQSEAIAAFGVWLASFKIEPKPKA